MAAPRKPKLSLLLDPPLAEIFDSYCRERGLKKSTFIAKLVRDHLQSEGYSFQPDLSLGAKPPKKKE
jgi:hypothetical protein